MKIALDAGHGGRDPGAVNHKLDLEEKKPALTIAKLTKGLLDNSGHETVMIRNNDKYVSLSDRAFIANDEKADIFISIHHNSFHDKNANGIETYHWPRSAAGFKLAEIIQKKSIKCTGLTDRGVKEGRFSVLRNTNMPAVLLEVGFISNPKEAKLLKDCDFLHVVATVIYNSIIEYGGE